MSLVYPSLKGDTFGDTIVTSSCYLNYQTEPLQTDAVGFTKAGPVI